MYLKRTLAELHHMPANPSRDVHLPQARGRGRWQHPRVRPPGGAAQFRKLYMGPCDFHEWGLPADVAIEAPVQFTCL